MTGGGDILYVTPACRHLAIKGPCQARAQQAQPPLGSDAAAWLGMQGVDEGLWVAEERAQPACHVCQLAVDWRYAGAGLGARILNWSGDQAAQAGAEWLRFNAWTTNPRLRLYHEEREFEHVRILTGPEVVSTWAAQRPARLTKNGSTYVGDRMAL